MANSEALRVLDENTAKYMVDQLKIRNEEQVVEINGLKDENSGLKSEVGELKDENLAMVKTMIQSFKQFKVPKDLAIEKLLSDCGKSQEEAKELVDKYWFDVVK